MTTARQAGRAADGSHQLDRTAGGRRAAGGGSIPSFGPSGSDGSSAKTAP